MSGNSRNLLITIWSIICASGSGVTLFEAVGPGSGGEVDLSLAVTLGFWILLWAVPVAVLALRFRNDDRS